jgi:hypothetical protein
MTADAGPLSTYTITPSDRELDPDAPIVKRRSDDDWLAGPLMGKETLFNAEAREVNSVLKAGKDYLRSPNLPEENFPPGSSHLIPC